MFVIGPDKKVKLTLTYPMTTGRNFDEVLRVIDSLQLTAKYKVATPADWTQGGDVIIVGAVKDEEAKELFPDGWESPKPYIRVVKQPVLTNILPSRESRVGVAAHGVTPSNHHPHPYLDPYITHRCKTTHKKLKHHTILIRTQNADDPHLARLVSTFLPPTRWLNLGRIEQRPRADARESPR